jgi:two-component system response regulator
MIEEKPILLVEDSPTDEVLTLRALEMSKIHNEVIVARDGVEALDYLFARGGHAGRDGAVLPSVVLLDLNLPKINGIEVLQQIRANERTKLLPVVILTSSNEDKDRLAGYLSGCNSYVQKPVDFKQFARAVRQLGLYWLVLNEAPPKTGN